MDHTSTLERVARAILISLVLVFFLFPIFWIFLMSFQTNESILRIPPSLFFPPTLENYQGLLTGQLKTAAGSLKLEFMSNLWNSVLLSTTSVALSLVLGRRPMLSRASSSASARTSPSPSSPSASPRRSSCSCP
jgi:multiple sugar transport system permease protein